MQLFYAKAIEDGKIQLLEEEARHVNVLRKKVGDTLQVLDGKGNLFHAQLLKIDRNECLLRTLSKENFPLPAIEVNIAIAPTKNMDRFEWFLEKATEIGVARIYPLLCAHSERVSIRIDRLSKILVSAIKQSKHYFLPHLNDLMPFEVFIQQENTNIPTQQFIAHCHNTPKKKLAQNYQKGKSVTILIGPEGDFSTDEIALALDVGYQSVSLGDYRLRTETAGIVACHAIQLLNDL